MISEKIVKWKLFMSDYVLANHLSSQETHNKLKRQIDILVQDNCCSIRNTVTSRYCFTLYKLGTHPMPQMQQVLLQNGINYKTLKLA